MAVRALCTWEALPSAWDKPRHLHLFSALKINSSVVEGGRQTNCRCFGIEVAGMALSRDAFFSSDLLMPSQDVGWKLRAESNFASASHIPPDFSFLHHTSLTLSDLLTASKHFSSVQIFCCS